MLKSLKNQKNLPSVWFGHVVAWELFSKKNERGCGGIYYGPIKFLQIPRLSVKYIRWLNINNNYDVFKELCKEFF